MPASLSTAQDLLARLVGFDTTSSKSNLALIDFVEAQLKGHGIASTRIPSPDRAKADLFATIGPAGEGGIGLSGHSDCVPVEGQRWTSDPFTLTLARRQALWPRQLRHEGLHRLRARLRAVIQIAKPERADPHHHLL